MTGKEKSSRGCLRTVLLLTIVLFLVIGWRQGFFGALDNLHDGTQVVRSLLNLDNRPSGVPKDAIYIEMYGGVDPDSASQEEIDEGMSKGRSDLEQAIQDMESEFYLDDSSMFTDYEQIPIDAFWVDTWTTEEWKNGLGETFYRIEMKYNCSPEERIVMQGEIDEAVKEYESAVEDGQSVWEKELIIHDKLVTDITYDTSTERTHRGTIYGALVEHQAVCEGYARAYTYLLDHVGVEGSYIATTWGFEEEGETGHAWNSVPSTSESCLVDVTWDDPDEFDANGNPYILHDYFLITPEEAERLDDHQHSYPISEFSDPVEFNYYQVEGWYQTSYDFDQLASILADQINRDKNLLSVKYADEHSFQQAATSLLGEGWEDPANWIGSGLGEVIEAAGGNPYESVSVSLNNEIYIINIYLNPQE